MAKTEKVNFAAYMIERLLWQNLRYLKKKSLNVELSWPVELSLAHHSTGVRQEQS